MNLLKADDYIIIKIRVVLKGGFDMKWNNFLSVFLTVTVSVSGLILSACTDDVIITEPVKMKKTDFQFGEQFEKKPIRIIKADGELYYDSGLLSKLTARCGTLDEKLKCTKKTGEIPVLESPQSY